MTTTKTTPHGEIINDYLLGYAIICGVVYKMFFAITVLNGVSFTAEVEFEFTT